MNNEVQRIISGKSKVRYGATIHAAISYLRASEESSALDKTDKRFKHEETEILKRYIENQNLWIKEIFIFPDSANILFSTTCFLTIFSLNCCSCG